MAVTVCPIAVINASVATVWELVANPDRYDSWVDARVVSVAPMGWATPGQVVDLRTRAAGRDWRVRFDIGEVDVLRSISIDVRLPLGMVNRERIVLVAVSERETRVTFN